ncbi:OmpA family protein [Membranihabitans marinus]|uniref:OmpA family protein n=1 Tax=Membranihabitans marinus TaxID=1227546 RepID=UPI001F25632F|nr:OmpA family protein [Membranihabitans marinus]
MRTNVILILLLAFGMTSCVSKKKFEAVQMELDQAKMDCESEIAALLKQKETVDRRLKDLSGELSTAKNTASNGQDRIKQLEDEIAFLKQTNTNLLGRLEEMSIISRTGAESIKKSLDALDRQGKYIQDLNTTLQRKDSLNLVLVQKLKRSLSDVNDDDVNVEVKKGVVYISLSDKLLFKSGSTAITAEANSVLSKIASIINDHNDFDVLVEGHTDNVPISTSCIKDNWDLSVLRATSIVRSLQENHNVEPKRMTAGGRSEFVSKADNENSAGRALNRRTEIIVLPKLDQYFSLMAPE